MILFPRKKTSTIKFKAIREENLVEPEILCACTDIQTIDLIVSLYSHQDNISTGLMMTSKHLRIANRLKTHKTQIYNNRRERRKSRH